MSKKALEEAKALSAGSFSYRVGTTEGAVIDKVWWAYLGWLRSEVEAGRKYELEHDAWDAYTAISVEGIPKFADANASSFVMYKRTRTGVAFLKRDGSWGSLTGAWRSSASSSFGMYKRQGRLLRYAIALDRWGFVKEHRPPALAESKAA